MANLISIDGRIVGSPDARARAVSSSRLYGRGVFTTIAISGGKPVLWEKHWRRLQTDAAKLDVDISRFSEASVAEPLAALISEDRIDHGRVRITFSDESPAALWGGEGDRRTMLTIVTGPGRPVPENLKLTVSPFRVNTASPLAGVKSCSYMEPLLALEDARARRFDEAIRLNEHGRIASACMANVFWLSGGRLFTPGPGSGCLPGTTREFILEKLDCSEVEAGIEVLREADDIFLTSAGIGVARASEFDGRKLRRSDHPILKAVPF